tara:strand:+ start:322 stop:534 length:213 start_codon:yes stop_codon:yes gene_type:complete
MNVILMNAKDKRGSSIYFLPQMTLVSSQILLLLVLIGCYSIFFGANLSAYERLLFSDVERDSSISFFINE